MDTIRSDHVNLLWSGGWDSTFRLLQLLLMEGATVQPHYVIDPERLSTGHEIRAMNRIKRRLLESHPELREKLLPTIYHERSDIREDAGIIESFERLRRRYSLGSQYGWLACFAKENAIDALELSIHRDDKVHPVLADHVRRDGQAYVVESGDDGSDEHAVFRWFRFPVFDLRKLDMEGVAKEQGFCELMEMSWFCFRPRANGRPCGVCNPCIYTIEEGLGRLIPLGSRLHYYLSAGIHLRHLSARFPAARKLLERAAPIRAVTRGRRDSSR